MHRAEIKQFNNIQTLDDNRSAERLGGSDSFKMSAFSRGTLLRPQCGPVRMLKLIAHTNYQRPRSFSSVSVLRAIKKGRSSSDLKSLSNKPSYTPTKSTPALTPAGYQSFESALARKSRPTILYQAPSHTGFMVGSYVAGGFCMLYAGFTFISNYIMAPPDLSTWVPIAFGGISLGMCAMGTWLILGPARIVNTIIAIPRSAPKITRSLTNKLANAAQPELQIEVELKKMFPVPFFPARKFYVKPGEIVLPGPLVSSGNKRIGAGRNDSREQRLLEEAARQRALEYERSHIMSAGIRHPFRAFSKAFYSFFQGTRRAWYREGFMKIVIKDQKYKLDLSGGWALDDGRALDRLSVIKPSV